MNIPFVSNTISDDHCQHAVLRMVVPEVHNNAMAESLLRNSWPTDTDMMVVMDWFELKGLLLDDFDYRKLSLRGLGYLASFWSPEEYAWQQKHLDFDLLLRRTDYVLKRKLWRKKKPTMQDIKHYFNLGYFVSPTVNGRALQGKKGHSPHAVLLTDIDDRYVTFHNPGLPAVKNQVMKFDDFEQCLNGPDGGRSLRVWK